METTRLTARISAATLLIVAEVIRALPGSTIRTTGDIIALSPPLIIEKSHVDELFGTLADILKNLD